MHLSNASSGGFDVALSALIKTADIKYNEAVK